MRITSEKRFDAPLVMDGDENPENWKPFYEDRVLIRRLPQPEKDGVVLIPDSAKRKDGFQVGIVVSTADGPTYRNVFRPGHPEPKREYFEHMPMPMTVKPGDVVLYERDELRAFEHAGQTYQFAYEEQHIAAILEDYPLDPVAVVAGNADHKRHRARSRAAHRPS